MDSSESRLSPVPSSGHSIVELIRSFSGAVARGDTADALRLVDRASRLMRSSAEIKHLYGKLLYSQGEISRSIELFAAAAGMQPDLEVEAALITALCADGQLQAARDRLERALRGSAIVPDDALAGAAREVVRRSGGEFAGWVGVAPDLRLHGEIARKAGHARLMWHAGGESIPQFHLVAGGDAEWTKFDVFCGRHSAAVEFVASVDGVPLLGGHSIPFPPDFGLDGRALTDQTKIFGWVTLGWMPQRSPDILIRGAEGFRLQIGAAPDPLHQGRHRFEVDRSECAAAGNRLWVFVGLPNGRRGLLPDSPLLIEPRPPTAYRQRSGKQKKITPNPSSSLVDIVIPVYRGLDETLACIRSVIGTVDGAAEIIAIDDASPEPALSEALDRLAASGAITVLRNPQNLGFPRSVNRGFALHPERDVIILNSDVEVFADWFGHLKTAAYGAEDIGTVTPLTNSGTIASYPGSGDPNCQSETAAEIDRLTANINAGVTIDLPTGVGFCMYVRRDCLSQVGNFDSATFAGGYGEENDFCVRATTAGWRHVLAADSYIRHIGGRSFGKKSAALIDRNLRLLNLRCPGYDATIKAFLASDPGHIARRRLDEARLAALGRSHVLLVTLTLEGGVRRAVADRSQYLRGQALDPILLMVDKSRPDRCTLSVDHAGYEDLQYRFDDELDDLVALLAKLRISWIEIHHFLGLPGDLIDRLYALGPVDITIHDYIWFCPRVSLLNGWEMYCGEPDLAGCESCIDQHGSPLTEKISVQGLRERSARWLSLARKVTVSCHNVAERFKARFPAIDPRIEPLEHAIEVPQSDPRRGERLKVALIGGIGPQKGYGLLLSAARDAANRRLPIEFVVIGYTIDDNTLLATEKAFVTGSYEEEEIQGLIARERPDVALFLSVSPETWCYALTHALRAGLPIAALDHGAIGERVRKVSGQAMLLPLTTTPARLNDALIETFCDPKPVVTGAMAVRARPPQSDLTTQFNSLSSQFSPIQYVSGTMMAQNLTGLSASVEVVPLVKGLYLFSVQATVSQRIGDDHELTVPALHVGLGPGTPADQVEFMLGPRTQGAWLCEPRDTIVVKVTQASTIVMMTTVRLAGQPLLEVEVRRLDGPNPARRAGTDGKRTQEQPYNPAQQPQLTQRAAAALPAVAAPGWHKERSIRMNIVTHVQNRGDLSFSESQWAGAPGQRLAIEAFTVSPLEEISPDMIEYKAVSATGVETSWIAGGAVCGSRGMGLALAGFAVRLKPQVGKQFTCEYGALLVSGGTIGPSRNGGPCRSFDPSDPIGAIWLSIHQNRDPATIDADSELPAPPMDQAVQRQRVPAAPKFSVFREPTEPVGA